jgi:8-oxo-dGTP pyrophosphatase MutT (NUDIX family)
MSSPFEDAEDQAVASMLKAAKGRAPKPKDASTLLLVRRDQSEARVLMGKRSVRHDFMPDKYVFPGGRVDFGDGRAPAARELRPDVAGKLAIAARRTPRAFGMAAVRELQEEAGLLLGTRCEGAACPMPFAAFAREGALPSLDGLYLLGRAITPPMRHKRFDARFFLAFAEEALLDERPPADGAELSDLQWVSLRDARSLDLPSVTRFMLQEAEAFLTGQNNGGVAYLRWQQKGHQITRL